MAKTSGEVFVAIFSDYELLANVSMTGKYVDFKKQTFDMISSSCLFSKDQMLISKLVIFFDMCSVIKLI